MFGTTFALIFRMLPSLSLTSSTVVGVLMVLGFSDPKVISFTVPIFRLRLPANASVM